MQILGLNSATFTGIKPVKLVAKVKQSHVKANLYGPVGHPYTGRAVIPFTEERMLFEKKLAIYLKEHPEIQLNSDIDFEAVNRIDLPEDLEHADSFIDTAVKFLKSLLDVD